MGACCSAHAGDAAVPDRVARGTVLDAPAGAGKALGDEIGVLPPVIKATFSRHSHDSHNSHNSCIESNLEDQETEASTGSNVSERLLSVEDFRKRVVSGPPPASALQVKVMTYNLHWWSLYGFRNGNRGSASKLIRCTLPDVAGFQECEDVGRVLSSAGLGSLYSAVQGPHALAVAYRTSEWELLEEGAEDVAEDLEEQYSGHRGVQWVRLSHRSTGKVMFFMNHFGPLRMNSGGKSGGAVTAAKIAGAIYRNFRVGDGLVLMGTFNATASSRTVRRLEQYVDKVWTGRVYEGIDHCFSPLKVATAQQVGKGGSDHDAVAISFLL